MQKSSATFLHRRRTALLGAWVILAAALLLASSVSAKAANDAILPHDYFAVVNANGTLARGTPGTTVVHVRSGRYNVVFPGSVAGCAAVANLGYAGSSEDFTYVTSVTTKTVRKTVEVDVTMPGYIQPGQYPNSPFFVDDSFHLHVDCNHALYADVTGNAAIKTASPGVTAKPNGTGSYVVHFGHDISGCAPVATVTAGRRVPQPVQPYLALGEDLRSLTVSVNRSSTEAVDAGFDVIVTCGQERSSVFPYSEGFYNTITAPNVSRCALTGSWYDPTPGSTPSDQGYVSTWAMGPDTGTIQTKNGGYGVAQGFGVDLVATC